MISVQKKTSRFVLYMTITSMGDDLCVSLYGGDSPHIGALALAIPHPNLRDPEKIDASVSMLAVTGHKESELAKKIAFTLATNFNSTVSVSCGIHLDNASSEDITDVLGASKKMLEEAISKFSNK